MEKALETIKKHIKDLERMGDVFYFYGCFSSATECKKANKELNEAIAELEAVEHNTCEMCKHLLPNVCICMKRVQLHDGSLPLNFGCTFHEPKDNA